MLAFLILWLTIASQATLIDGRCSVCVLTGQSSTVTPGGCYSTLAYYTPFYDENGRWHSHDANSTWCSFTCRLGHAGTYDIRSPCWCGWPKSGPWVKRGER